MKKICIAVVLNTVLYIIAQSPSEPDIYTYDINARKERIKELESEIKNLKKNIALFTGRSSTELDRDIASDLMDELRREKKEKRKELLTDKKRELDKYDTLLEAAQTDEEYQKLLDERKSFRKEYLREKRRYKDEEYVEKKVEESVDEFRTILTYLDRNALTFVTNGTRISKQGTVDQYFFGLDKTPSSKSYTEEFGQLFKSDNAVFLSWKGENNDKARQKAAYSFAQKIKASCVSKGFNTGIKPASVPINLVGHSHGGNIMILTANHLLRENYNVQLLLTLNTPRREYVVEYPVEHVQLYSYDDKVQSIGAWDFDLLWQDMDYKGPAARTFENAVNINLNYFLDYETYSFFTKEFLGLYKTGKDYYHQITRYLGIIEKVVLDESKIRKLKMTIE